MHECQASDPDHAASISSISYLRVTNMLSRSSTKASQVWLPMTLSARLINYCANDADYLPVPPAKRQSITNVVMARNAVRKEEYNKRIQDFQRAEADSLSIAMASVQSEATVQSDIFKPTKFGGKYTTTLIPGEQMDQGVTIRHVNSRSHVLTGDGIGAEVAESVKTIFKADNVPISWEQIDVTGVESGNKHSEDLFRESIASLRRNKLGLKGTYGLEHALGNITKLPKAFCTHLSSGPAINRSMLPCVRNSTFMRQ